MPTKAKLSEVTTEIERVANAGGSCADLSAEAFDYLFEKSSDEMPYGTQKARDGDPYEWLDENVLLDYVTTNPNDTVGARLKVTIECIAASVSAFELRSKAASSETEKAWASGVVAGLKIGEKYLGVAEGGTE